MVPTTMIRGRVMTQRAAVAGISGDRANCRMTKASRAQEAFRPNLTMSHSAMRLARRVFTSMELRMKASRLSQITSMPSTSMIGLAGEVRVIRSRNMRIRDVT